MERPVLVHSRALEPYEGTLEAMRAAVSGIRASGVGELWWVQHPPVFTQGQAGRPEHVLAPGAIPVVQSDRGGQVTYHGPGQQILYVLLPIGPWQIAVRDLVEALEHSVISLLARHGVDAAARRDAPGVYVDGAKIASLGLRVRHGVSYHGIALNVDMDLTPFSWIHPCGYADLTVTQWTAQVLGPVHWSTVRAQWLDALIARLQLTVLSE